MKNHDENHIFCGGLIAPKKLRAGTILHLNLHGKQGDDDHVTLRIENFHLPLGRTLSPRFIDLLEIAAYVYAADQATVRQYQDTDRFGIDWRQKLHFRIPVRDVVFWQNVAVKSVLAEVLNFLGDHFFTFEFTKATKPVPFQEYLTFEKGAEKPLSSYDEIAMFSGGLDSLAGAVEALRHHHRRMVFVTHLPTTKNNRLIANLRSELRALSPGAPPLHIAIEVNKSRELGKEPTQRVRSFLFACLGATTAHAFGMEGLTFFENGVISLNLPLCGQVVGGRATRTTHPRVLAGFSRLFTLAFDHQFEVTNPYLNKTKAGVVRVFREQNATALIAKSVSCAHTWERRSDATHCGECSQCLDRRLAMLSADAFDDDPEAIYRTNIFTDPLPKKTDRILVSTYLERARMMRTISTAEEFMIHYSEVLDALPYVDGANPDRALRVLFDLYKRHAVEIDHAIRAMFVRFFDDIRDHRLPGDCLVRIVTDSSGTAPIPIIATPVQNDAAYVFKNFKGIWDIRFRGGERFYLKNRDSGCRYLHHLLANPDVSLSALELERRVNPPPPEEDEITILGTNHHESELIVAEDIHSALEAISPDGLSRMNDTRADLVLELEEARLRNDEKDAVAIDGKIQALDKYLRSVSTKAGTARLVKDRTTKTEDTIRAAINRALKTIKSEDPRLHVHFSNKDILRFGVDNIYRSTDGVEWETS